eukprot:scaffold62374_cov64-Phaeocystis_antarctica.AAC.3
MSRRRSTSAESHAALGCAIRNIAWLLYHWPSGPLRRSTGRSGGLARCESRRQLASAGVSGCSGWGGRAVSGRSAEARRGRSRASILCVGKRMQSSEGG